MKYIKVKYHTVAFLWCAMLAFVLTSCFEDDPLDNQTELVGNRMQLHIVMKSAHSGTRATDTQNPIGGETGDGLRPGTYNENNIYSVYLYQYNSAQGINAPDDTPAKLIGSAENINFRPSNGDLKPDKSIEKDVELGVGAYKYLSNDHFIVVVNYDVHLANTTLGELRNAVIESTWSKNGAQAKNCDMFAMSNSKDSHFMGGFGSKENPLLVSIDVERVAARIDFAYSKEAKDAGRFRIEDGKYIYKVENSNDEVALTHVRVTNNMSIGSYLIKRLAATESATPVYLADETNPASKYVVEPFTWIKNLDALENGLLPIQSWFGDSWYVNAVNRYNSTAMPWFTDRDKVHCGSGDAFTDGTSLDEEDHDWQYYILDYANENTMKADQTLHNYTTGLILKATYKPENIYKAVDVDAQTLTLDNAYTAGKTFWRWHDVDTNADRFFSNLEAAEEYQKLFPHSIIFAYENGQCYYNVWLRHENIVNDPTTTMMEFGIVRNNIYRVCVEFTGVGMPDIPDDMTTPESIRMFIYVRKWNLIEHPTIEI